MERRSFIRYGEALGGVLCLVAGLPMARDSEGVVALNCLPRDFQGSNGM
jgi:hypothetical protein